MQRFVARNGKQLTVCLKLLYAEKVPFSVKVEEYHKGRIMYTIEVTVGPAQMLELREKYRILIS